MDEGRRLADIQLSKMEQKIRMEYEKALKEMRRKGDAYFEKFKKRDAAKKKLFEEGKISEAEYLEWRKNQMMSGMWYSDMRHSLAEDLSQAREHAQDIVRDELPDIYAEAANYGFYEVENGLGISTGFNLVDRSTVAELLKDDSTLLPEPRVNIPKELRWNSQHINSALLQGILQGESVDHIARRLRSVTDMSRAAAIRNARTMTTAAENRGRVDSYRKAQKMGIKLKQRWVASHDGRTRETHRIIDGEIREVDEPFSNGCRYPGDPNGEPKEVYNCRCTLIAALDDYPKDYYSQFEQVGTMTYEEWKHAKPQPKRGKGHDKKR